MARSVWKGPFVDGYLYDKAEKARASSRNEIIKTWSRRSTIVPEFVGLTFAVYNGQKFLPVYVVGLAAVFVSVFYPNVLPLGDWWASLVGGIGLGGFAPETIGIIMICLLYTSPSPRDS